MAQASHRLRSEPNPNPAPPPPGFRQPPEGQILHIRTPQFPIRTPLVCRGDGQFPAGDWCATGFCTAPRRPACTNPGAATSQTRCSGKFARRAVRCGVSTRDASEGRRHQDLRLRRPECGSCTGNPAPAVGEAEQDSLSSEPDTGGAAHSAHSRRWVLRGRAACIASNSFLYQRSKSVQRAKRERLCVSVDLAKQGISGTATGVGCLCRTLS